MITSCSFAEYVLKTVSRSASRMRCTMTCFAVCAAMRPKSLGVTSSS